MKTQDNIYNSEDTRELLNPTFTEASTRANINSGESHKTIFGKIKKWFSSLGDLAFLNKGTGSAKFLREDGSWQSAITGSGTNNYIAKFTGAGTIGNGPAFGSDTTKYLRNDGSWIKPPNDNTTYSFSTGDGNGQIKITPSSGSAYNISVKGLGNLAYISKDSSTSHYLRGDGSWVTPPDTDTKVDNTVWESTTSGAKHKRSNSGDQWGLIKNNGSYSAWIEYESGNIGTPGSLTANGGIGTDSTLYVKGQITTDATALKMYNCKFNVTPKNGYPYFENSDGENFCLVVGDNNHRYKLSWTGSKLAVHIDNTVVGNIKFE